MLFANKVFEKKLIGVSSFTPTVKNNETLQKNEKIREQDMISKKTSITTKTTSLVVTLVSKHQPKFGIGIH
jgi:hypothetical protein